MKTRMPNESCDLEAVAVALALAVTARKPSGKQRKRKAAHTDQEIRPISSIFRSFSTLVPYKTMADNTVTSKTD